MVGKQHVHLYSSTKHFVLWTKYAAFFPATLSSRESTQAETAPLVWSLSVNCLTHCCWSSWAKEVLGKKCNLSVKKKSENQEIHESCCKIKEICGLFVLWDGGKKPLIYVLKIHRLKKKAALGAFSEFCFPNVWERVIIFCPLEGRSCSLQHPAKAMSQLELKHSCAFYLYRYEV